MRPRVSSLVRQLLTLSGLVGLAGVGFGHDFWVRAKGGKPEVGKAVALTFDDGPGALTAPVLRILRLEEAPATFLFSHLDLIATLLRRAAQASDACFERVRSALFSVATGQARPRAGRAEIDEAELRRAAREASLRLTPRSPEQRFFEAITKHADARLAEEHAADDDEFFDL